MRECRKHIWEGETMYVKDHMTKNPFTITEDTVIAKALEIMRKNSTEKQKREHETNPTGRWAMQPNVSLFFEFCYRE